MALNPCEPVLIALDETCGCTVTKATKITSPTPEDLNSDDWKETGLANAYARIKEGRLCGVQEKALTDLLFSRLTPRKRDRQGPNNSIIQPFFLEPSPEVINTNYFAIESGGASGGAANTWKIKVKNSASEWATNLPGLERYFITGHYISIHYKDAANIGRQIVGKITAAANADAGGVYKADVTFTVNKTLAGFNALDGGAQAVFQPEHGVVQLMANAVSDRESWCQNKPANINWKWRDGWWQTFRKTHCVNDLYLEALNAPLTSEYFKKFRILPLAQQRKQHQALEERMFYNTIFFGERMNEKQTTQLWMTMDKIMDPIDTDCPVEYPSTTEGIIPQLRACNRVIDFLGGALDVDQIMADCVVLARRRGDASGQNIVRIEALTDSMTLANFRYKYLKYAKAKFGFDQVNLYYQPGQKMIVPQTGRVLWNYEVFQFLDLGLELAVMSDYAFDDHIRATPVADQSVARYFMLLDWSDIDIYLGGSKAVSRQTNVADNIYNCIITPNVTHYSLESITFAPFVHDPNRDLVYTNFSTECPILTPDICVEPEARSSGSLAPT